MHAAAASCKEKKKEGKTEVEAAEDEARATFTFIRFVFVSCFDLPASSRSLPQDEEGREGCKEGQEGVAKKALLIGGP